MRGILELPDLRAWTVPLAWGLGGLLLGVLIHALGRPLVLRMSRRSSTAGAIAARLDRPLSVLLPLAGLLLAWQGLPDDLPGLEGVRHATAVALILAVTFACVAVVRGALDAVLLHHPQDVADNLHARQVATQARVLSRIAIGVIGFAGLAFVLMTFPRARQFGASLLASAGVSALVLGIAARSVFGNLLAGLQIALSQPLRIDDVLIVQGEWGRVEEITGTYVVLKIWDERRLVIPLQWFIENPFQNWTRSSAQIIGSVTLWVDFETELEPLRAECRRLAEGSSDHDGRVCLLQVVDTSERAMQLRLIVSSASAGQNWDLRCMLREGLVDFLRRHQPRALPRLRMHALEEPPAPPRARSVRPVGTPPEAPVNDETGMAVLTRPTKPAGA